MTADPFDVVSDKLGGLRNGMAHCPSHEDREPSLSVTRCDDGRALLKCYAGCTLDQIVAAIGLKTADLFPARPSPNGHKHIVATYDYTDDHGALLFQVVRYEPKGFRQRRPNGRGRGGWEWSLKGTRRVLYRLPRVLGAVAAGATVYVVEGEKDVEALERAGVTATCNPQGAGKWSKVPDAGTMLAGATVIVVADRDEPGRRHAAEVAADLRVNRCTVMVVEPPAPHKDIAEMLGVGLGLDALVPLAQPGPSAAPTSPPDDLAALLDDVVSFLKRFMVMTDHQTDAVTLFAAHTHAVDAFDVVAYLFITSAVRRSGKTLLEELLEQLCLRGRSTTNISPAAVYRMVDEIKPTLLFDEVDNIFPRDATATRPRPTSSG
jgi:Toprim-like